MKVKKTTLLNRQIHKYERSIEAKIKLAETPLTESSYRSFIEKEPQTLINEQKFYKAIAPFECNEIKERLNIDTIINQLRSLYGRLGVTKVVQEFFKHPAGAAVRFMQNLNIDYTNEELHENYLKRIVAAQKRSEIPLKKRKYFS